MDITVEQQAEIDFAEARDAGRRAHEAAREAGRYAHELAMENLRHVNSIAIAQEHAGAQIVLEKRRAKLEAVRLAKEALLQNKLSQPVDSREVTAADIQAYAETLVTYIDA